jgi:hypothetical protein
MTTRDPLVGEEARDLVDRDYAAIDSENLPLWERDRALKVLGRECDSFPRLGAGLLAWVLGVGTAAGLAVAVANDVPLWGRALALVAGAALAVVALSLGRRAWKAGRRVVDAFCWWTLLPERMPGGGAGVEGWRASPVRDAVQARVFVFEGWRVLRTALGSLAFLTPFAVLALLQGGPRYESPTWVGEQTLAVTVFLLALAAVSFAAGGIVLWGQYRAARAHAERDPIQRWIFRR